ncbi:MAG: MotA/TolQ/ExbB proton channel family protein [Bacteriovoracaceae bacterium]
MFENLFDELRFLFNAGGEVMYPLVAGTFGLWFALGYRFLNLKRGVKGDVRSVFRKVQKGSLELKEGCVSKAFQIAEDLKKDQVVPMSEYLNESFMGIENDIKLFKTFCTSIVVIAPLLGLLGTVGGMISTFDSLGDGAMFAQGGGIAGGISQALVSTQMGLVVAIPGVLASRILLRKEATILNELDQIKELYCTQVGEV